MRKGLVSVLLTSYNRPKYLRCAIESVIAQTYQDWELWILDDNSDQEVTDIIGRYVLLDPRIHCYNSYRTPESRRSGICPYAENINHGLDVCEGEFITYLTDDDFYYPKRLEVMVAYLNSHEFSNVVAGWQDKIHIINGVERIWEVRKYTQDAARSGAHNIDHNSVMHRASCLEKTGKWPTDDVRCADAGFWNKLNAHGYVFDFIEQVTDAKRYHNLTLSAKMDRGEDLFRVME